MKPKPLLAIILILWLATGLRFYRLDAQSFWNDEGNSARLSERPIPAIIEGTASDIHPPLYYLILRGWRELVGETEFGLRSFSAFVGIGTVALTFALAKEIEGRDRGKKRLLTLASTSSLLTAVSPPLIYYSQETRMYALLAFWAVLATWLLLRWQSCVMRDASCVKWMIGYVIIAVAGMYTHYFFPAILVAHNLLILIWLLRTRPPLPRPPAPLLLFLHWTAVMLTTFLLYLPWLPIFIRQAGGKSAGAQQSFLAFLLDAGRWLALGATIDAGTAVPTLVAAGLLLMGGVILGRNWTAVILLIIPILFMFAAGTTQPEFFKFMLVAVPFFGLLTASVFHRKGRKERKGFFLASSAFFTVSFLILLVGNGRSLNNLYHNPAYARADYRSMAARIADESHPNAGIILDAPNQWEVFTYYHRDGAPVYPIPMGKPNLERIAAELTDIAVQHGRLYAIFWGEAQRDPERLVERWLDEHAFKATDEWVGDVRFVTYAVPAKPAAEMTTATSTSLSAGVPFGDAITLNGYTLASNELAPGDIVQITLFWETAVPLPNRYKVFLHLLDENGNLIAQRDSEPGGGLNLTTNWEPGRAVIDNHGILIPADTPSGAYQLHLGLYDIADPAARLSVEMGTAALSEAEVAVADSFSITTIFVSQ